jgi:hypothetical protein
VKGIWPSDGDIRAMLALLPVSAFVDAPTFHAAVYRYLTEQGWNCSNEWKVADRGDGSRGRVDIVIHAIAGDLGIELDDRCPRQKSRFKVSSFVGGGFVVMRASRTFVRIAPARRE